MLCLHPIRKFSNPQAYDWSIDIEKFGHWQEFMCRKCRPCRWYMTRQWALRCVLESRTHERNSFVNLTYSPEHLPKGDKFPGQGTLVVKHLQDFIKRLRRDLEYHDDMKIRYYAAGEYGEQNGRAHYHILIFGYDFPDKKYWRKSKRGFRLYRSDRLEKLWRFGHAEVGELTYKTAGYVAGYIRKKVHGDLAEDYYKGRKPEFCIMSKKPPIGSEWLRQNSWVWKEDLIRLEGKSFRPPYAFEMIFKKEDPEGYEQWLSLVKANRQRLDIRGESADDFADEAALIDSEGN